MSLLLSVSYLSHWCFSSILLLALLLIAMHLMIAALCYVVGIDYCLQSMQNLPDHCPKVYIFWQYLLYANYCLIIKPDQKIAHALF